MTLPSQPTASGAAHDGYAVQGSSPASASEAGTAPRPRRLLLLLGSLVGLSGMFLAGYLPREARKEQLAASAARISEAPLQVATVRPKPVDGAHALTLAGALHGHEETVVYARANGYVRRWHADIGDQVKAQQLLLELDTPELDREIEQARAVLAQAEAAITEAEAQLELSRSNLSRYESLSARGYSSKQQFAETRARAGVDEAGLLVRKAGRGAELAKLHRLQQLKAFSRVLAPFAGTITSRTVERGSLVNAGLASPLFAIAAVDPLRVMVSVPQTVATSVRPGLEAVIVVPEYPERKFTGTVVRSAGRLDEHTRTLDVEIALPNPERLLLPGMYVEAKLDLRTERRGHVLPATAIVFTKDGTRVATVSGEGRVRFSPVVIIRDSGAEVEIGSGLSATDEVIANPGPSIHDGAVVQRAR